MIGSTIIHLDTIDSTNNYAAKELLTKSLKEGTLFVAACQQMGRGQGGSSWESGHGLNLTFSIVLYPQQIAVARQFYLSMAISLGVADFLSGYLSGVSVKWPNDIYVNNKKIAGILIETAISGGKFSRAIIGIGLNVNQEQFDSDAPNPVSMKNVTSIAYDLHFLLPELCGALDKRYVQLLHGGYDAMIEDYHKQLYRRGVWAKYNAAGEEFEGMITAVHPDGQLQIETRNGQERGFYFKEVAFI